MAFGLVSRSKISGMAPIAIVPVPVPMSPTSALKMRRLATFWARAHARFQATKHMLQAYMRGTRPCLSLKGALINVPTPVPRSCMLVKKGLTVSDLMLRSLATMGSEGVSIVDDSGLRLESIIHIHLSYTVD